MNLFDVLHTSSRIWLFTLIGIAVAILAWCFLPASSDRLIISGWAITIGYTLGWLLSFIPARSSEAQDLK